MDATHNCVPTAEIKILHITMTLEDPWVSLTSPTAFPLHLETTIILHFSW